MKRSMRVPFRFEIKARSRVGPVHAEGVSHTLSALEKDAIKREPAVKRNATPKNLGWSLGSWAIPLAVSLGIERVNAVAEVIDVRTAHDGEGRRFKPEAVPKVVDVSSRTLESSPIYQRGISNADPAVKAYCAVCRFGLR